MEPVLDFGIGPTYECGICGGEGMIEIDGPIHQKLKQLKQAELEHKNHGNC